MTHSPKLHLLWDARISVHRLQWDRGSRRSGKVVRLRRLHRNPACPPEHLNGHIGAESSTKRLNWRSRGGSNRQRGECARVPHRRDAQVGQKPEHSRGAQIRKKGMLQGWLLTAPGHGRRRPAAAAALESSVLRFKAGASKARPCAAAAGDKVTDSQRLRQHRQAVDHGVPIRNLFAGESVSRAGSLLGVCADSETPPVQARA